MYSGPRPRDFWVTWFQIEQNPIVTYTSSCIYFAHQLCCLLTSKTNNKMDKPFDVNALKGVAPCNASIVQQ